MHLTRFKYSFLAVPVGFVAGFVLAWIITNTVERLTVFEAILIAAAVAASACYVPLVLLACSLMRGVDILESLRSGPLKAKPQTDPDPAWLKTK